MDFQNLYSFEEEIIRSRDLKNGLSFKIMEIRGNIVEIFFPTVSRSGSQGHQVRTLIHVGCIGFLGIPY